MYLYFNEMLSGFYISVYSSQKINLDLRCTVTEKRHLFNHDNNINLFNHFHLPTLDLSVFIGLLLLQS